MDQLNRHFNHIYLLNRKTRVDRLHNAQHRLKGLKYEIFEAVDEITKTKILTKHMPKFQSPGQFFCLLSHILIIQDAIENHYDNILILEDDVLPKKKFVLPKFPNGWKLLYLGANQHITTDKRISIDDDTVNCYRTRGTFAYAIDSSIYESIVKVLLTFSAPVDVLLGRIQNLFHDDCHITLPYLFGVDVTDSDVTQSQSRSHETFMKTQLFKWKLADYVH